MSGPLALDLFCGAGGASRGLARAGFDVTGVDLHPQPRYPFRFIQADALTVALDGYDLVWASPPCQAYSWASGKHRGQGRVYPDLVAAIRTRLATVGQWVIENVIGAPMLHGITLCGAMFGLSIIRHRHFESSTLLLAPPHIAHPSRFYTVAGHMRGTVAQWAAAMGIDGPMTRHELAQAVPPAYAEYVGHRLREAIA